MGTLELKAQGEVRTSPEELSWCGQEGRWPEDAPRPRLSHRGGRAGRQRDRGHRALVEAEKALEELLAEDSPL